MPTKKSSFVPDPPKEPYVNIAEQMRLMVTQLDERMVAAGRVPAPGQTPRLEADEATNSYRLVVDTIPIEQCPHPEVAPINIVSDGLVRQVLHCTNCKKVLS